MSVLGFWDHMVSVTTALFHQCLSEAAIDDTSVSDGGRVPVKPGSIRKYTSRPCVPTPGLRNQEELELNLRLSLVTRQGRQQSLLAVSFLVYENGTEMAVTSGVLDVCARQRVQQQSLGRGVYSGMERGRH